MVLEVLKIDPKNKGMLSVFEQAYYEIFVPTFPDPEVLEPVEIMLKAARNESPYVGTVLFVAGEHLHDPSRRILKGVSTAHYYYPENVGLLAYNAVSSQHREKGMGKLMVDMRLEVLREMAREKGRILSGAFVEVSDPQKISPENDSIDPAKRIALFESWGARLLPLAYTRPPLTPGGSYSDTSKLMSYPVEGKYADVAAMEAFLRAIYLEFRRNSPPEKDTFFRDMVAELKRLPVQDTQAPSLPGYRQGLPEFRRVMSI